MGGTDSCTNWLVLALLLIQRWWTRLFSHIEEKRIKQKHNEKSMFDINDLKRDGDACVCSYRENVSSDGGSLGCSHGILSMQLVHFWSIDRIHVPSLVDPQWTLFCIPLSLGQVQWGILQQTVKYSFVNWVLVSHRHCSEAMDLWRYHLQDRWSMMVAMVYMPRIHPYKRFGEQWYEAVMPIHIQLS